MALVYSQILAIKQRSTWCKPRPRVFWKSAIDGVFGGYWFRDNLRMHKDTFFMICDELKPHLSKKVTRLRRPISVDERVAVTLWRLATNVEYRTIACLFGLGTSTVGKIVLETCEVIVKVLLPKFVKFPSSELAIKEIVDGFENIWGFPQAVGAIDGTHIPILKPVDSPSDYYNRKSFYSIIIQGVVDFRGRFMDINVGWPGKVHDARVFANSSFFHRVNSGVYLPNWTREIKKVDVPLCILGDPAYPLLPWLMKPYAESVALTNSQRIFNYRQSRARMVVENAFGRLKGRW